MLIRNLTRLKLFQRSYPTLISQLRVRTHCDEVDKTLLSDEKNEKSVQNVAEEESKKIEKPKKKIILPSEFHKDKPGFDLIDYYTEMQLVRENMAHMDEDFQLEEEYTNFKYPKMAQSTFERHGLYIIEETNDLFEFNFRKDHYKYWGKWSADIVIIGGGIVGTSIALALKERYPKAVEVVVIDRDLNYTNSQTALSFGGIRHQFSLEENTLLSLKSFDLLRNFKLYSKNLDLDPPNFFFQPQGYLFLHTDESRAYEFMEYQLLQTELGAFVDVLGGDQIKARFPFINTSDVLVGTLGTQLEGWFDINTVLRTMKARAEFLGAYFIEADVIDFNLYQYHPGANTYDETGIPATMCNHVLLRTDNGRINEGCFAVGVIAAGAQTGYISNTMLGLGSLGGMRSAKCPIIARKRYTFVINCPDAPCLDFPVLVDPSGIMIRRDGYGGNFIVTKTPSSREEEPPAFDMDVDFEYYENVVKPALVKRVPILENSHLVTGWATLIDANIHDGAPLIGYHPYYFNVFWVSGFGDYGASVAPALGYEISHLLLDDPYDVVNLEDFGWQRIFSDIKLYERLSSW